MSMSFVQSMARARIIAVAIVLVGLTVWAFSEPEAVTFTEGVRVDPADAYNPVTAGEPLPSGFRQLLPRDAITPIYDPVFVGAGGVAWPDETQVLGIAERGDAKAYPVSFLNGREMVVDEIAGGPILVTW